MSINEKNKRFLNTVQSSQWKIVHGPDESDDAQVVQNPILQDNCSARQDFRHRLLRDATAFYRNDTSHFLGELQKAESLLNQRVNLISKIDFLPPKRKTSSHKDHHETQDKAFDEQLSDADSDLAAVQRVERKKHKNDEPDKLIVDVKDFIDTFSVAREPVYHLVNKKKLSDCVNKTEYDFLLNQVVLKRENDKDGEAPGQIAGFAEQLPPDNVAVNDVKHIDEPSIICQDVLPFADAPFVIQDYPIQLQTHLAIGVVENVFPCHSEFPLFLPENDKHRDSSPCLNETNICEKKAVPEENSNVVESPIRDVSVKEIQVDEALVSNEEPAYDAEGVENEILPLSVAQLPEILEYLGEFAGDQCDDLADYIKDKVYDGSRLIAFCGMKRGVGCSTMTLLAARGIMRHGLKTAVIDANFEFPKLNSMITGQQQSEESWVNILHGRVTWETLGITPKDMPLLTVFPLAENALVHWSQHEPERLQQETNRFVAALHESFDLILLDCGCLETACEEITWGELALFQPDGVILVRNPKETPGEMLEPCCREILNEGIGAFGVAENFV